MSLDNQQLADQIGELGQGFAAVKEQVQNFAADISEKYKSGQKVTDEVKEKADKCLSEIGEMQTRMTALEKKQAREFEASTDAFKTLGEKVLESDAFKASSLSSGLAGKVRVKVERSDITSANTTVGAGRSAGTSLVPGMRLPGVVADPNRRMTVRDLLMQGQTTSQSVEYVQETGFTNNAAMVAEGAAKPQSEITFNMVNTPVRTLAHWVKASRQILDDSAMLQSYIDGRLRYGLDFVEEQQFLNGNNTGQNLNGILNQATAFSAELTIADEQAIDRIRLAILQVFLAEYPASGIVLHPTDWAGIELLKGDNDYIIGTPQGSAQKRLWNLPVVDTQSIAANTFLVGAFNMGAQIFDRMDAEVMISTEDGNNFTTNMVTVLAEERTALAVYRPEAFVTGDVVETP